MTTTTHQLQETTRGTRTLRTTSRIRAGGARQSAMHHLVMLALLPMLLTVALNDRTHAHLTRRQGMSKDSGASVIEMVVIGLGMLLLATAVVAGITGAVNGRLSQIT